MKPEPVVVVHEHAWLWPTVLIVAILAVVLLAGIGPHDCARHCHEFAYNVKESRSEALRCNGHMVLEGDFGHCTCSK